MAKRNSEIQVGDLIQYLYRFHMSSALTTRRVDDVLDGGAEFRVEGGYLVAATQITCHVPMHREEVTSDR